MNFSDLQLSPTILATVKAEGYEVPTPIQAQAIPHVLEGRDVLGCAQTGTGKTAAFAMPILHRLASKPHGDAGAMAGSSGRAPSSHSQDTAGQARHGTHRPQSHRGHHDSRSHHASHAPSHGQHRPRCLVLCPTRELASQIGESFRVYGRGLHLRHVTIFGGVGQNPQVDALRRGVDIVIATPGRLLDLMQQRYVDLTGIEVLVLDEADRMLDMGFIEPIRDIVAKLPSQRQTLLFSATMPTEIRRLADSLLRNPAVVTVKPVEATTKAIVESVFRVDKRDKPELLAHLLQNTPMVRTLVFTRTKHGADRLVRHLYQRGIRAEAIHGNKTQGARQRALTNFISNKTNLLIATDIASRGIDVDNISHVVNYDLTHEPETYVHRIGRTGRAGATGVALSFCDHEEVGNLKAIERLTGRPIAQAENPLPPSKPSRPEHVPSQRPHHTTGNGHSRPAQGGGNSHRKGRGPARPSNQSQPSASGGHPHRGHGAGAPPRDQRSGGGHNHRSRGR